MQNSETIMQAIVEIDDYQTLRQLNRMIIARMRDVDRDRQQDAGLAFSVGQIVTFNAKTRGQITGTIMKINRKSMKVKTPTGTWAVAPSLCEIVS